MSLALGIGRLQVTTISLRATLPSLDVQFKVCALRENIFNLYLQVCRIIWGFYKIIFMYICTINWAQRNTQQSMAGKCVCVCDLSNLSNISNKKMYQIGFLRSTDKDSREIFSRLRRTHLAFIGT